MKVAAERIVFVLPLPGADELGEAVERLGIEAERLACFARGRASAVGDDVGGHGRAEFAITLIDVLNGALALGAAGQVEIDVRPLAALLGEKALEEQVHSNRIDGGDAERVADHAVGRRAAPLHQNALAPAELHDVPDDEEVAGESELGDERQLALCLLLCAGKELVIVLGQIAVANAFLGALFEERLHRLAFGHGIVGKAVAEIAHLVGEAGGKLPGVGDGLGKIAEELPASRAVNAGSARRWREQAAGAFPACSGGGWW